MSAGRLRAAGKTGAPGHYETVMPTLSGALLKIASEARQTRLPDASKTARKGPIQIPDETVLEIRRRYEIEGWAFRKLVRAYPDIKPRNIRRFIDYETRCNLRIS